MQDQDQGRRERVLEATEGMSGSQLSKPGTQGSQHWGEECSQTPGLTKVRVTKVRLAGGSAGNMLSTCQLQNKRDRVSNRTTLSRHGVTKNTHQAREALDQADRADPPGP